MQKFTFGVAVVAVFVAACSIFGCGSGASMGDGKMSDGKMMSDEQKMSDDKMMSGDKIKMTDDKMAAPK